jgi:hypothetical protein
VKGPVCWRQKDILPKVALFPLEVTPRLQQLEQVLARGLPLACWQTEDQESQVQDVESCLLVLWYGIE